MMLIDEFDHSLTGPFFDHFILNTATAPKYLSYIDVKQILFSQEVQNLFEVAPPVLLVKSQFALKLIVKLF